jgi:AbiV family abortive infection protein
MNQASRRSPRNIPVLSAISGASLVRMPKVTSVPDLDSLSALAVAAARNSRRMLDDAELLLKRGRRPSAYSLAVLAFEEAGKAWLCIVAMMVPADVRPDWPHDDLIAKHVDKLMAAHAMANMLASAYRGQGMLASLANIGENQQSSPWIGLLVPRSVPRLRTELFNICTSTWEPVSGFEPLTCRLQDGCSAN